MRRGGTLLRIHRPAGGDRPGGACTFTLLVVAAVAVLLSLSRAQSLAAPTPDDQSIQYASAPLANPIERLNARLNAGAVRLQFQRRNGYLHSAIDAIGLHVDSQMLVFSDASFQARRITAENPRAIFFKDDVALGWVSATAM